MIMNRFIQRVIQPGSKVASVPLVFFTVAALVVMQFPINLLIREGWISAGIISNELLIVAGIPILIIWRLRLDRFRLLPFKKISVISIGLVLLATFGADILIDYLTIASESVFPIPEEIENAMSGVMEVSSPAVFVWKFLILCILPALCEEIFFRGYCQGSLRERWGPTRAIVVASMIFALLHGNPWLIHLYFLLGLLMGIIYELTGTLWAPIACHIFNNGWTFINHIRGFKFPLEDGFGFVDLAIFFLGAILFICAIKLLKSQSRPLPLRSR